MYVPRTECEAGERFPALPASNQFNLRDSGVELFHRGPGSRLARCYVLPQPRCVGGVHTCAHGAAILFTGMRNDGLAVIYCSALSSNQGLLQRLQLNGTHVWTRKKPFNWALLLGNINICSSFYHRLHVFIKDGWEESRLRREAKPSSVGISSCIVYHWPLNDVK